MVNKYIVYQDAVEDFNQIIQYITYNLKNPEGAMKLIQLFDSKLHNIMSFPNSYPIIIDSKLELSNLRKCRMENYLIIYILNQELAQIEIIRIIYQRVDYLIEF